MQKNALTAIITDSEAAKSTSVVACGLALITTLEDPIHKIIVFGICCVVAAGYGVVRQWGKNTEINAEAMKAEAHADAAEALVRVKNGD